MPRIQGNLKMLEKSIIVSAHPDDEILWFSSILDKVDELIICFLDHKSYPDWKAGREKTLSEYPLKNISSLGIDESEVFNGADWANPVITKFGIKISNKNVSDKKYIENYYKLKNQMEKRLAGYRNVFTHSPWGEYGSEDHILVYRVIRKLKEDMKFNLWFSNYCSNKSFNLMLRYIDGFNSEYVTLKTNKKLGNCIQSLYKGNGCWTWYADWEWFNEESFMKDKTFEDGIKTHGHIFPLNMIKMELPVKSKGISKMVRGLIAKISRNRNNK